MSEKDDENTLRGRLGRYGRVSGTMAGLAARLAGERLFGVSIDRESHARALLTALGGLKGPVMKVAQILATIPEALPPEYARALGELQSNAPPMGWPFVRRRMRAELGAGWEGNFATFGREAAAAASLGQVHRAVLHDGRAVACKLQYPDMASAIEADLNQLKMVFSLYELADRAFSTRDVHAELADRLREELDYGLEARYCNLYREILKGEAGVHVPEVVESLSTRRLLTSTWMEGRRILDFVDAPQQQRDRIAIHLFQAWYVPFYSYAAIHGDPHLGNYTVRPDGSLNLLDFGCMRLFRPAFVGGVIELYRALMEDDDARAVHAYETWGFSGLSKELIEVLNTWARFLYGPVMDDRARAIGQARGGMYGRETAIEVHKRLRAAGGVSIPREFVFMDRAALGLGSVFIHLQAKVNWYRMFNEVIEGFDVKEVAGAQARLLPAYGLPVP